MIPAILTVLAGMVILLKSADMFVDGASSAARHFGMPALLIGMVVVGFGTSAPELLVSSFAAFDGNPGIALGNAYGSNIANIGLILGTAALVSPISVHSLVLKKELPVLTAVTALAAFHLRDGILGRGESFFLLVLFLILTGWALHQGLHRKNDALGREMDRELKEHRMTRRKSVLLVIAGLLLLVASSRLVVWEIGRAHV